MKNLFRITQQILQHRLTAPHSIETDIELFNCFLQANPVCFADDKTKTQYIQNQMITAYLNADIAKKMQNGESDILTGGKETIKDMIKNLSKSQKIYAIKIYGIPPVSTILKLDAETVKTEESHSCTVQAVPKAAAMTTVPQTQETKPPVESETAHCTGNPVLEDEIEKPNTNDKFKSEKEHIEWKLVSEVKNVLSLPAAADRRKIDPAAHFENLHSLLGKLIQANGLDPKDLDKRFGVPHGFTKSLCDDLKRDTTPKEITRRYLEFFGLSQFLYIFQKECSEIAEELRENPQIDVYKVKQARNTTEERFRLLSVKSKLDHNNALIYRLELQSPHRTQNIIVSTPFNFIVGKEYAIEGLSPIANSTDANRAAVKGAATLSAAIVASKEEEAAVLTKLQKEEKSKGKPSQRQTVQPKQNGRMTGKNRYMEETPEERFERERGVVLKYIIRTTGCNARDAQGKFEPLSDYPDIVSDFAKYIKSKKPGSCSSHGYNAKRLMDKLHYSPYDAYVMLACLERDTKKTQEVLKYRETDPQYQKPEKSKRE